MCVRLIKVSIPKKSGNLLNAPRTSSSLILYLYRHFFDSPTAFCSFIMTVTIFVFTICATCFRFATAGNVSQKKIRNIILLKQHSYQESSRIRGPVKN